MEETPLGQTALGLSRVGFGCAAIGGYDYGPTDDRESIGAVEAALEAGVTLFDTADIYGLGHADEVLRRGLGDRARDVVIATKVGVRWDEAGRTTRDLSPGWIVRALETSLRRLGIECIPLYQLHWPDPDTPIGETMQALERCREAGKVLHLGCCNFSLELVEAAQAVGRLESIQLPFSLGQREWASAARVCNSRFGMSVLCYNPLAQGLFGGCYGRETVFGPGDLRSRSALFQGMLHEENFATLDRLQMVAARLKRSTSEVAIRWVLEQPAVACAITGAKRPAQVRENVRAADWRLSTADLEFLSGG
jgi:aryl-alcohol dehydrogenase-like predicted oxidoreductase